MSTAHARSKAARGTKRTCQACEVRFYDLGRDHIVCPMCGAEYVPPPPVAATTQAHFGSKTGWHRQPIERPQPAPPVADALSSDRFTPGAAGEDMGEGAAVDAEEVEDSVVLDEQDDTDVADLVERDDADENEPR